MYMSKVWPYSIQFGFYDFLVNILQYNRANNEQGKRGEVERWDGDDHDDGENGDSDDGGDHDDVEKGDSLQCRASLTGGGARGRCLWNQVMLWLPQYASFALKLSLSPVLYPLE